MTTLKKDTEVQKKSKRKVISKKVAPIPKGTLELINHMRCHWVVPAEIIAGQTKSDVPSIIMRHNYFRQQQKVVSPNSTVIVDKAAFDKYYKGSRAFQAMIDLKHIKVSRTPIPEPMLGSVKPATPPPDLTSQPTVAMHIDGDKSGSIMDKMPNVKVINK